MPNRGLGSSDSSGELRFVDGSTDSNTDAGIQHGIVLTTGAEISHGFIDSDIGADL